MNKLLEEIFEECKIPKTPAWPDYERIIDLEKFAKLIIEECADICEVSGKTYAGSFTPKRAQIAENAASWCGILIRKHFGVNK